MDEAARTHANCQVLQQALLHRAERQMVSCGSMVTDKNIYGLALLIRGHWEATAMMGYFCDRIVSLIAGKIEFEVFQWNVADSVMGARHEFFKEANQTPNMLSCIEKAERFMVRHMGFPKDAHMISDNYGWLSEFCHPNFLSHSIAIELDKSTDRMRIRHNADPREIELKTMGYLAISASLFLRFFDAFKERATINAFKTPSPRT